MTINGKPPEPEPAGIPPALQQLVGAAWMPSSFAWKISKGQSQGQPVLFLQLETVVGRSILVLSHDDALNMARQLQESTSGLVLPPSGS